MNFKPPLNEEQIFSRSLKIYITTNIHNIYIFKHIIYINLNRILCTYLKYINICTFQLYIVKNNVRSLYEERM